MFCFVVDASLCTDLLALGQTCTLWIMRREMRTFQIDAALSPLCLISRQFKVYSIFQSIRAELMDFVNHFCVDVHTVILYTEIKKKVFIK